MLESYLVDFGFFFPWLATSNVFLEVAPLDQVLDLILQLGALFCGVPNILMIRTILVLINVRSMSKWDRAAHEGFIGDGVQDLLFFGC